MEIDVPKCSPGLLAWPPLGFALIVIALFASFAFWFVTDAATMERLSSEGGPIETLTAVGYCAAILALVTASPRSPRLFIGSAFATGLLLARELDLHRITSQSALAINSYEAGGMPLGERIAAGTIVLLLAALLATYLAACARPFWRALRACRPAAWTILAVIALLAWSATIDGLARKARDFLGIELPLAETKHFLGAFEEGMELLIPVLILLALAQALWARRRDQDAAKTVILRRAKRDPRTQ